ncbi:ABC transporter ATP-binding protein [Candidatus Gottesmanbacteria bacterium RIFCSPHIGHO2_01_FULL_42_12]|uniref:ABC transporter ATP-binding protein n=1 Tax=Candidatus Gottesmanbacteria bacterium RIFCSPHIGHO2_01_FULL_42_12 TaxID=1798377 RepID=A0A1F5Z4J1_9BACT|nr:MAG: ABC transporter ATP-binding protein [Candidatus Gottesmanbacteria bacterium RIFCSPHIGHO2_01_FULL_42_12]
MTSFIKLDRVSKKYLLGDDVVFTALENISLEIKAGEFTAIIGPSGSGKSTLMHIIGLLDKFTTGELYIGDKEIDKLNDNQISALRNEFVGFVFQQFNLLPKLTVLENVLLPSIYTKKTGVNFEARALDLLKKFGIDSKKDSYPNKISGGQQQRVAIARALIMKPPLILADEPTGNLDSKTGAEIIKLLKELNVTEGITIIVVTHDPNIAKVCQRQIKIVDGKIVS